MIQISNVMTEIKKELFKFRILKQKKKKTNSKQRIFSMNDKECFQSIIKCFEIK